MDQVVLANVSYLCSSRFWDSITHWDTALHERQKEVLWTPATAAVGAQVSLVCQMLSCCLSTWVAKQTPYFSKGFQLTQESQRDPKQLKVKVLK